MSDVLGRARPWMVVLVLTLLYCGAVLVRSGGDPRVFVTLNPCFEACTGDSQACPFGAGNDYDGQFAYYIARDPAGAAPCQDVPAYRYQRILLPLLGWGLTLGTESLIPLAFVLINLAALVGATALLERMLVDLRVSRWYALVYGLFLGVFMSVRLSTTEPLAYGLILLAIWLGMQGRPWLEALAYLLAGLAKEMALIFAGAAVLYYVSRRDWRGALRVALVVGVPFALWQLFLRAWLGSFGIGSGGAGGTPFEVIPFMGFLRTLTEGNLRVFLVIGAYTIPFVILPALWAMWQSARWILREGHRFDFYLLANAAVMMAVPFSTYREPLGIFRFIVGLVIAVLLFLALRDPRGRPLRYTWAWLAMTVFISADFTG